MSLKAYVGYQTTHAYSDTLLRHFNAILSAKSLWPDTTTDTLYVAILPTP